MRNFRYLLASILYLATLVLSTAVLSDEAAIMEAAKDMSSVELVDAMDKVLQSRMDSDAKLLGRCSAGGCGKTCPSGKYCTCIVTPNGSCSCTSCK